MPKKKRSLKKHTKQIRNNQRKKREKKKRRDSFLSPRRPLLPLRRHGAYHPRSGRPQCCQRRRFGVRKRALSRALPPPLRCRRRLQSAAAVAAGTLYSRGGSASHAAVVARPSPRRRCWNGRAREAISGLWGGSGREGVGGGGC